MKKVLFVLFIFTASFAGAQDLIITKDGKKINAQVSEINENDIRYKDAENMDGPSYFMKKSEIASIIYKNGKVDVFQTQTPLRINYTAEDFSKAKKLRNAGIGCFAASLALETSGLLCTVFSFTDNGYGMVTAGTTQMAVGSLLFVPGVVMWIVGAVRMDKISANGYSLYENKNIQLNLAAEGNNMGLRLNF